MQHGSLALVSRKEGPAVWQFGWSEKDLHGARVQRKRVIGTVERYLDEAGARSAIAVLLAEINSDKVRMGSRSITVAQLCDHFEQRELARDNTWRSYSTKKTYQAYLIRWVLPHWRHYELAEVRIHALPMLCQTGENSAFTRSQMIGFLPAGVIGVGDRIGDKRSCANTFGRLHKELESRNASAGTRFVTRIRRC